MRGIDNAHVTSSLKRVLKLVNEAAASLLIVEEIAMPSELRHLMFRPAEVVQAIKAYHRRLGTPLPAGIIQRYGPEGEDVDGTVRFRIAIVPDPVERTHLASIAKTSREIVMEGPALAAALILHCRDLRIPLPANAVKSLRCSGEQVYLVVTVNPK